MANIITLCRIILSVLILPFPAFSPLFYGFYIAAGFTDMIDGTVARKTNTVSELGSRLDTIADFIFVAVCMVILFPVINVPPFLWVWTGVIAVIKIVNVVSGYVIRRQLIALHTVANKITGALLFLLPLTVRLVELRYSGSVICAAAPLAAIQEGYLIRTKSPIKKNTNYFPRRSFPGVIPENFLNTRSK